MEKQVYKHILLASELSSISGFVAKKAKQIAEVNNAKLTVLHAVLPLVTYASVYFTPDLQSGMVTDAKKKMQKLCKEISLPADEQLIIVGNPKEAILDAAEDIKADLIVVGSHHNSWFSPLLGSTASNTISRAKCDVLTVPVRDLAKSHIKKE